MTRWHEADTINRIHCVFISRIRPFILEVLLCILFISKLEWSDVDTYWTNHLYLQSKDGLFLTVCYSLNKHGKGAEWISPSLHGHEFEYACSSNFCKPNLLRGHPCAIRNLMGLRWRVAPSSSVATSQYKIPSIALNEFFLSLEIWKPYNIYKEDS